MRTHHTTLNTIQRIDFDPDTFTPGDLLWLPHHAALARAGKKRQTEHLAGRIAAVHALRLFGEKAVPGIGELRQPLWPAGLFGSISHCGKTAVAVVSRTPTGIDIERVFDDTLAASLAQEIATDSELAVLRHCSPGFTLALTLAFSAKESLYKAFSLNHPELQHFHQATVISVDEQQVRLNIAALTLTVSVRWFLLDADTILTVYHTPSAPSP
jgi:enterobactin synthetase component D